MIAAFLICMGIASTALALLFACAAVCAWWESWHERRYVKSPEEVAWEEHVATTPGVGEIGDTPIFDALCFEAWEADLVDAEEER